jgi:hypothetical protein
MFKYEEREIIPATTNHDLEGSGHSKITALREIIDNAVDSGSKKINIFLDKDNNGEPVLVVVDFGSGFKDKSRNFGVKDIHMMAVKNFTTKDIEGDKSPSDASYLGRYGNGLKNALAKLSHKKHASVLTAEVNSSVHVLEYDQRLIQQTGEYIAKVREVKYVKNESDPYRELWVKYMSLDEYGSLPDSGTIVIIRGLKLEVYDWLKNVIKQKTYPIEKSLGVQLGETYNRFIKKGLQIYLGLSYNDLYLIQPQDPVFGLPVKESKTFLINNYPVVVNTHLIPKSFKRGLEWSRQLNNLNSGLYVYRADRLHLNINERPMNLPLSRKALEVYAYETINGLNGRKKRKMNIDTLNMMLFGESHGRHNHIRITLEFPPELDKYFNVNTIKTEIDLEHEDLQEVALWAFDYVHKNDKYNSGFVTSKANTDVPDVVKPVSSKAITTRPSTTPKPVFKTHTEAWNIMVQNFTEPLKEAKVSIIESCKPEERPSVENALSLFTCFLGKEI